MRAFFGLILFAVFVNWNLAGADLLYGLTAGQKTRFATLLRGSDPEQTSPLQFESWVQNVRASWESDRALICNHPVVYEFLRQNSRNARTWPSIEKLCPEMTFVTSSLQVVQLNFKELKAIDYVLAGAGQDLGSRFGHAMVRFRFCEEGQLPPQCTENPLYAQVFGFMAQSDEGYYSFFGGIDGKYPSHLVLKSDAEVRTSYLIEQLRDITYSELKLTDEQKKLFFYGIAERFWSYQGRYKFLTSNCAGEMLGFMNAVLDDRFLREESPTFLSPRGLESSLASAGIFSPQPPEHLESQHGLYEGFVTDIRNASLLKFSHLEGYAKKSAVQRRGHIERAKIEYPEKFKLNQGKWFRLEEMACAKKAHARLKAAMQSFQKDKEEKVCSRQIGRNLIQSMARYSVSGLIKRDLSPKKRGGVLDSSDLVAPEVVLSFLKSYQENSKIFSACSHNYPAILELDQELESCRDNLRALSETDTLPRH